MWLWPAFLVVFVLVQPMSAQWQNEDVGDVPYIPTPPQLGAAMLTLAQVKAGDVVYDLGCGDGRIVITAAMKYAARGVGIDINPERIKEAVAKAREKGVADKVKFLEKDLFEADFHEATVVTLYLLPEVNLRLRPILLKQLKVGARVVSHSFDLGDWAPDKKIQIEGRSLYLWTVTEEAKSDH